VRGVVVISFRERDLIRIHSAPANIAAPAVQIVMPLLRTCVAIVVNIIARPGTNISDTPGLTARN